MCIVGDVTPPQQRLGRPYIPAYWSWAWPALALTSEISVEVMCHFPDLRALIEGVQLSNLCLCFSWCGNIYCYAEVMLSHPIECSCPEEWPWPLRDILCHWDLGAICFQKLTHPTLTDTKYIYACMCVRPLFNKESLYAMEKAQALELDLSFCRGPTICYC